MLLNFCHPCLRPAITCSTISTEKYDVTNLISDSSEGFLAYSCIKPPIHIDLTFICNIQINRVIIWPTVGSQKSSGFQLLAKSTTDAGLPYAILSNAYLAKYESGVIFYRRDINKTLTSVPPGFLQRYIKINNQQAVNKTTNLRLYILKTENSVPAIGRIEVWGRVAACCSRDVIAGVNALWIEKHSSRTITPKKIKVDSPLPDDTNTAKKSTWALEIPEELLDPITYEIMVQPIMLPSGKIIDQFTLERHEQNEALWGRSPSDPFTGIPFSNTCRPAIATALKLRIDKFLIENSNADEIKKLPRTTGCQRVQPYGYKKILNVAEVGSRNSKFASNSATIKMKSNHVFNRKIPQVLTHNQHKLPVVLPCAKPSVDFWECKQSKHGKSSKLFATADCIEDAHNYFGNMSNDIDRDLELNVKSVLSGLKRFRAPETCETYKIPRSCSCCTISLLYELPCKHVVCRKVLSSNRLLQCQECDVPYKTSDPKRIHE